MILNRPDDQNESARAAERERFDETAQVAFERELEERINQRLGHTAKLYNLTILVTVLLMFVAVTFWIFNINGKSSQPKTSAALIPADFSNNLQVARQQLREFEAAYADSTNLFAAAYVDGTNRIALLENVDALMLNRATRLKAIDAEIDSQTTTRLKKMDTQIDAELTARLKKMDTQIESELTPRVARLNEIAAQISEANIPTNFQRIDVQLQDLQSMRSNTEAIFVNVSEMNDYFVALYSLRPDANNRINRSALDPLRHIAQNKSHSLSTNARAALQNLANGLESERQIYLTVGQTIPFNTNTITFDQTVAILKRQTDPYRVIKLLTFIANNTNFSKAQQMSLMMDTYQHSTNLVEVYVAELAIKSEARLDFEPFSFDQVQDWWRTHQSSYR